MEYYIDKLKNIWTAVYDMNSDTSVIIKEFFHPNYEQCINGITMQLPEYINHVIAQKKNMVIENIEYLHHLEKEDVLFAIYYPKGKNSKGLAIEAEVIAYFQFHDKKILKIHGQVRIVKGSFSDVDM